MFFGKSYWKTQEQAIQREWLLTNGIGGFAGGTITGMNARRYHGLLVASFTPPVDRYLILSAVSESVRLYPANDDSLLMDAGQRGQALQEKASARMKKAGKPIGKRAKAFLTAACRVYLHSFRTPIFRAMGVFLELSLNIHTGVSLPHRKTIPKRICFYAMGSSVCGCYRVKNSPKKGFSIRLTPPCELH